MKYFELVYDQSSATFAQRKHRKRPCGTANHMQKSGHEVTEAVDVEEFAIHLMEASRSSLDQPFLQSNRLMIAQSHYSSLPCCAY